MVGGALVLIPGVPLVTVLVLTHVLNAVLLPLLAFMYGIARDPDLMGHYRATRAAAGPYLVAIAAITVCIAALAVTAFG